MNDAKWAARQLKKGNNIRRKGWGPGEYAGNDGSLFYRLADPETFNGPSVTIHFNFTLEDILANDWVKVKVLPRKSK